VGRRRRGQGWGILLSVVGQYQADPRPMDGPAGGARRYGLDRRSSISQRLGA